MTRRKLSERNIRKITKVGGTSLAVTLPAEFTQKLGWRDRQKVVAKLRGSKITIEDWKK
jgi:antitoxin component of MazEF toxin-antitoxin module